MAGDTEQRGLEQRHSWLAHGCSVVLSSTLKSCGYGVEVEEWHALMAKEFSTLVAEGVGK
jgi:hypothetical protein